MISTAQVSEMRRIETSKDGNLVIGGGCNFGEVLDALKTPGNYTLFGALQSALMTVGSTQVRNSSTLCGNIMLNDNNSDLIPVLLVGNAKLILSSKGGNREIDFASFFKGSGARNVDLKDTEVISSIVVPPSAQDECVISYKVSRRENTSRSVVGACLKVRLDNGKVADSRIVYGGVSSSVRRATNTEKGLLVKYSFSFFFLK